ncbi:hypothetical protein [Halorussus ruber]|uniref:hypothetical protein n=1 Tax=Halorussus ruber TaxID=1126238 RepID=UPI001B2FE953|nr:hypothetical protein [Halorussus ruber]
MNTDRRRFLGLLAGVAAGGAGASALARTGRADAGATFAASDVTVRTHDGALGALTIAPAGTVSWSGLEEPAENAALVLYAKLDSALRYRELDGQRLDAAGLHGETEFRFETRDLLDGRGFSPADFTPDDGERRTRTVRLRLGVTVFGADETVLTSGYADATFDVTVENRPEETGADGRANTGGEAENGGGRPTETTTETTTTTEETETTTEEMETTTETTTAETTTATETTPAETTTTTTETTATTSETTTTETTATTTTEATTERGDGGDDGGKDGRNKNSGGEKENSSKVDRKYSEENKNNASERSDAVASLASATGE